MALVEEPEWCLDMFNHFLDMCIAQFEMVLDAGYEFDSIYWPDDMGYKFNQFFSKSMYRELLLPVQKRAIEWAHSRGVKAHLHSCGDIHPFVPDLADAGLDALNPLSKGRNGSLRLENGIWRQVGSSRRLKRSTLG